MRRGRLAAALAVALLVGGCGVAGETGVTRDHIARRGLLESGNPDVAEPRKREQSGSPEELVTNYLRAAAGEPKTAIDRVRAFMPPGVAATFNPSPPGILVVRQLDDPVVSPEPGGGGSTVSVRLQPVGILTEQGAIRPVPPEEQSTIQYPFRVVDAGPEQRGSYLSNPYPRLLLSTTAFDGRPGQDPEVLYREHLLYFWDTGSRTLVPDLRYLPRSIPAALRPTEVVRRLAAGPSEWLGNAVQSLPSGTDVRGNVVLKDGRLAVDLNAKAIAADGLSARQILAQLRWSLWNLHYGPIVLQIEGQERASDDGDSDAYLNDNPAWALSPTPDAFCVADGVVVAGCTTAEPGPAPLVLRSETNRGVVSAAVTGDDRYAALVRRSGGKRPTLVVGRMDPGEAAPTYVPVALTAATIARPVWLNRVSPRPEGLVVADGRLYHFDSAGAARPLPVAGVSGIQAVAAAPDGRRIAFIAGGSVYVAPLSIQAAGGALAVGRPQRLETTLDGLTAVGFSRPERLVVSGTVAGKGWLAELSVDGAIEDRFHSVGDAKVTALAAYADNPANSSTRGPVMVELDRVASYQVFATQLRSIQWRPPGPSATLAPGQNTGRDPSPINVTAPFFES